MSSSDENDDLLGWSAYDDNYENEEMQDDNEHANTIHFCVECNNMLYPVEDKATKDLHLSCRICGHRENARTLCVHRRQLAEDDERQKHRPKGMTDDPTLPRTKKKRCPQCRQKEAVYWPEYPRHRDGNMTMCFECCFCSFQWDTSEQTDESAAHLHRAEADEQARQGAG